MTYTVQQIVLTFATALGAYNGFPEPPQVFKNLVKNELVQWVATSSIKLDIS